MKELSQKEISTPEIIKPVRKEESYIASMRPHKGQYVFRYSRTTKKITRLTDKDYEITADIDGVITKKLIIEKNTLHVVALNERNARKKFARMILNQLSKVYAPT